MKTITDENQLRIVCEYENYAIDHIKHFNAIPVDFVSSDGVEMDADECWFYALLLRLNKFIKEEK